MQARDYIELLLLIASFILATISVTTVIITIRQNNKMIKSSTRPYIVALTRTTIFKDQRFYIVIKNFGNAGATIKKMNCSFDLSKASFIEGKTPFNYIKGTFLAPGQSISCCLNTDVFKREHVESFVIELEYGDEKDSYEQQFPINYWGYVENANIRASSKDNELEIISFTLQDLVEKQF